MSLPEEHKTAIISNGLHFVRSITEAYGSEKGMELWEQIASVLDPEIKGQLFFAMITGTYNDRIELRGMNATGHHNAVACIKEIRQWTGLGLKESKDIVDRLRTPLVEFNEKRKPEYLKVNHEDYSRAISGLRQVGFTV